LNSRTNVPIVANTLIPLWIHLREAIKQ
jgi:hypothetical protein